MSLINSTQANLFSFGDFENIIYRSLRLLFSTSPDATALLRALSEQLCGTFSTAPDSVSFTELSLSADSPSSANKPKEVVSTSSNSVYLCINV